jgi:hypothetical protein
MALIEINRIVDTVLTFYEGEKPLFDTIIANYLDNRQLTLFKGIRKVIPESNLPSIEVAPVSSQLSWHACRVQEDNPSLEIQVSVNIWDPALAVDLEGKLVSLAVRILVQPPQLRPQIQGTNIWLYDSVLPSVQYGSTAAQGNMRVAKISWSGKALDYLTDTLFFPFLQGGGNWVL